MKRFALVFASVCVLVLGAVGCAREEAPQISAEVAFDDMWDVLDEIDAPEERVPILEAFMVEYPDTSESVNAMGDVVYYRTEKMDDLSGAITVTRRTLDQTKDPELRFNIGLRLHTLAHRAGETTDLGAVAEEMAAHRELGFVSHHDVVEAAEQTGAWEVMLEHAVAMEAFANETAFRAAYPDDDFSDERVEFSVNRRRAWVLAYQGGALTNLSRLEEAQEVFDRAEELPASTDFLGIPETPIDIYRGQAALLLGRPEQAAEFFAHNAVMGGDAAAMEGLQEAYVDISGSEDGFDYYLLSVRERIARPLVDVTLTGYEGLPVILGPDSGKVMVLSFWNPG